MLDYRATAFNVYVCLNQSWRYEHNQYEGVMKNQDIRGNFFQNLGNFHIYILIVNGKRFLLVAFIIYTLLYTKL